MFEALKRVKAWIELDGTHELGPGPRESQRAAGGALPALALHDLRLLPRGVPAVQRLVALHRRRSRSTQVRLFNMHPSGAMHKNARLESVMGEGGVADCGKAQNCVEVCPKEIPLVDSIAGRGARHDQADALRLAAEVAIQGPAGPARLGHGPAAVVISVARVGRSARDAR